MSFSPSLLCLNFLSEKGQISLNLTKMITHVDFLCSNLCFNIKATQVECFLQKNHFINMICAITTILNASMTIFTF